MVVGAVLCATALLASSALVAAGYGARPATRPTASPASCAPCSPSPPRGPSRSRRRPSSSCRSSTGAARRCAPTGSSAVCTCPNAGGPETRRTGSADDPPHLTWRALSTACRMGRRIVATIQSGRESWLDDTAATRRRKPPEDKGANARVDGVTHDLRGILRAPSGPSAADGVVRAHAPRRPDAAPKFWETARRLVATHPDFVSVTYGAAGTDRATARQVVGRLLQGTPVLPIAHLTCVGASREDVESVITDFLDEGVRSFLALRATRRATSRTGSPRPTASGRRPSSSPCCARSRRRAARPTRPSRCAARPGR